MVTIDCIADLHGHYPKLEGGDLLIVAGDLTATHTCDELLKFCEWVDHQKYSKCIVIAGNHDTMFIDKNFETISDTLSPSVYLCDSGIKVYYEDARDNVNFLDFPLDGTPFPDKKLRSLKIWGSPWTLTFPGINPHCTAFTGTEEELEAKFAMIPNDTDILITHGPAQNILDKTTDNLNVGSKSLLKRLCELSFFNLRMHIFGHIHEAYQHSVTLLPFHYPTLKCVDTINCSHVNERYEPVNNPIRIIL